MLPVAQGQGLWNQMLCQVKQFVHLLQANLVFRCEALADVCEVAGAGVQVALVQPVQGVAPGSTNSFGP